MTVNGASKELSTVNRTTHISIELCCTWDQHISDGILNYKLENMEEKQKKEVREAFDSWNKLLTTPRLIESTSQDQEAEIIVTLGDIDNRNANQLVKDAGAGQTAGQSVNNLNQSGYITSAKIILSNEIFNNELGSDTLYAVVLHEIGHVLGLGHANFDDLMNPLVNNKEEISVCDVNGVFKTNEPVLEKNASLSLPPIQSGSDSGVKKIMNC